AFLIARVIPHGAKDGRPRYRCIAAYHHQDCYEDLPAAAISRFVTLLKQRENAEVVRAEIQKLQGKHGRWTQEPKLPKYPCPFTASLLGMAWCVDNGEMDPAGNPYTSGMAFAWDVLTADCSPWDERSESQTVIDVTEPESPAYCHIQPDGCMVDAERYMRYYGYVPSDQKTRRLLHALDGIPLVTLDMIDEAWLQQGREELEGEEGLVTVVSTCGRPRASRDVRCSYSLPGPAIVGTRTGAGYI
ncbi:uncharacterized protein B0H18DRAFT_883037, partial [Fomitopsis serialis]|uniref:uncharacterized protein n=1 Tax=Fomitopsis serialis TaxID=139415 RepID=UPI002008254D